MATESFGRIFTVNPDWGIKNLEKAIDKGSATVKRLSTAEARAWFRETTTITPEMIAKIKARYGSSDDFKQNISESSGKEDLPELAHVAAILIHMKYRDTQTHNKPHVHVVYGEYTAEVAVDGELLEGSLPAKQLEILVGWLAMHEEEVYGAWNNAVSGKTFSKITD